MVALVASLGEMSQSNGYGYGYGYGYGNGNGNGNGYGYGKYGPLPGFITFGDAA